MKEWLDHLTVSQRIVLVIATLVAITLFVLPPVGYPTTYNRIESPSYGFLFDIRSGLVLDYGRLLTQYGLLALTSAVLMVLMHKRG